MTVETFLANFGHLANAPNGVRKLRELILQLAVQGKLVSQDPKDEPAAKLLERIRKEKAPQGAACRAPVNPVTPDEMSCELPQAWEWVRFGDIAQHNAGQASFAITSRHQIYIGGSSILTMSGKCRLKMMSSTGARLKKVTC